MKDTQCSTKTRKKPSRRDGGEDFRNLEGGSHVPKNKYKRKQKTQLQDEIIEELNNYDEYE